MTVILSERNALPLPVILSERNALPLPVILSERRSRESKDLGVGPEANGIWVGSVHIDVPPHPVTVSVLLRYTRRNGKQRRHVSCNRNEPDRRVAEP